MMDISVEQTITVKLGNVEIDTTRNEARVLYDQLKIALGIEDYTAIYPYNYPWHTTSTAVLNEDGTFKELTEKE